MKTSTCTSVSSLAAPFLVFGYSFLPEAIMNMITEESKLANGSQSLSGFRPHFRAAAEEGRFFTPNPELPSSSALREDSSSSNQVRSL